MNIYLVATDLNFIRRFLDKDYIKNTIIYTGMAHLRDIVYILTKYFNFEITHISSYHNTRDKIEDLKTDNFEYIYKLRYFFDKVDDNDTYIQCSHLFNFPVNFS
jgi:hypothetical protein